MMNALKLNSKLTECSRSIDKYSTRLYTRNIHNSVEEKKTKSFETSEFNVIHTDDSIAIDVESSRLQTRLQRNGNVVIEDFLDDNEFRQNEFNIQMLSRSLYEQIFGRSRMHFEKNNELVAKSLAELKKHGLPGTLQKVVDVRLKLPDLINGDIEEHFYALGKQQSGPYKVLVDRFANATIPSLPLQWNFAAGWTKYTDNGEFQCVEYPEEEALIFDVEICCTEGNCPVLATAVSPTHWYSWTSKELYAKKKTINKQTIIRQYSTEELIPLETSANMRGYRLGDVFAKPRIIVGHNVSFDRARIKEQYWLERTGMRFLDTMSLHIAVSGVTSYQKAMLKSGAAEHEYWSEFTSINNSLNEVHKFYCGRELKKETRNIFVDGSLADVANDFQNLMTYCAEDVRATGRVLMHLWPIFLQRFPHPVTLAGMLELSCCYLPVNRNWRRYVENSQQTFDDMNIEAKLSLSQQADRSCQLLHGEKYKANVWLWNENWQTKPYKLNKIKPQPKRAPKTSPSPAEDVVAEQQEKNNNSKAATTTTTTTTLSRFDRDKMNALRRKFSTMIEESRKRLPVKLPHLAGYPEWYRKLCRAPPPRSSYSRISDWKPGPQLISTSMKIVPKLLSLTWNFMPLHYVKDHGWCYIVPYETEIEFPAEEFARFPLPQFFRHCLQNISSRKYSDDVRKRCEKLRMSLARHSNDDGVVAENANAIAIACGLVKLPHKNGADLNVGNPLARDFVNKFSDSEMRDGDGDGDGDGARSAAIKMIEISRQLSYWKNNRDRIENQFVVRLKDREVEPNLRALSLELGAILPNVIVCGTLTRRAVESTWMTAANAVDERIGSELRAMIQAPPGYRIVGADVDSQELWIASLIGDSYYAKEHGCTPFGWMTLSGQKADQTDMHSVTAKTMGISRNDAKVINYARIYGAGEKFANRLLKQFVPGIEESRCASIARKMMQNTKGRRCYELKADVLPEQKQRTFTTAGARQLCLLFGKRVDELFERPKWINGSESAMFNSLEEIACSDTPRTPFLNARLTKALEPAAAAAAAASTTTDTENRQKFMPTRINWVVQSSAVDFLHLMLVCMRWLIGPRIRFCLSFHDELRYLVPDEQKYQTVLALHVSNLFTRSFCVQRLGMRDLPQSVAFFSSVEVDTVLRKESKHDCVTPSNPHGLSKGYGVSSGESLDIIQAVRYANAKIGNISTRAHSTNLGI